MWTYVRLALLLGVVGLVLVADGEANASPGVTELVSVSSGGAGGDGPSEYPAMSADGRYVAFDSLASNLVLGDTNGCQDVFVHDRLTGVTERVSVATGGAQGTRGSLHPAISADGRYVAFDSWAPDLVAEDTNDWVDIFVRDRQMNTTERVSLSSSGVQGNDTSWYPAISGDGRFVAFESFASNLVAGDTNNVEDVFVRDRQAGSTTRVSLSSGGVQGNNGSWDATISSDGQFVAFGSNASNLVTGDTNGYEDIFVRDRQTSTTTRISLSSTGGQANAGSFDAAISGDGRFIAFGSDATNLVAGDTNGYADIFVRDRQTSTTTRISLSSTGGQANAGSFDAAVSADGRYVAFESYATNLVDFNTNSAADIFVRDRQAGTTIRVSLNNAGFEGDAASVAPSISDDGRFTAFESVATDLVLRDTNDASDIFLHDRDASPVGGIAELPDVAGRAAPNYAALAALAVAMIAALGAGAWYAGGRRRS